jgi:SAM-dependent methyltransferase
MAALLRQREVAARLDLRTPIVQHHIMTDPDLSGALTLNSPEACLAHYRAWADSYDSGFADGMDYLLPAHVAAAFRSAGGGSPVLDVGAGTGLLAERLREMGQTGPIDAVDFSAEMLGRAADKGIYRTLAQADITQPIALPRQYGGIVSSGTFTAGHVGPDAFAHLLALALPGAQFALSVNLRVWSTQGFDRAVAALQSAGQITALQLIEVQIYGAAAAAIDPDHATDRAQVVLFRAT